MPSEPARYFSNSQPALAWCTRGVLNVGSTNVLSNARANAGISAGVEPQNNPYAARNTFLRSPGAYARPTRGAQLFPSRATAPPKSCRSYLTPTSMVSAPLARQASCTNAAYCVTSALTVAVASVCVTASGTPAPKAPMSWKTTVVLRPNRVTFRSLRMSPPAFTEWPPMTHESESPAWRRLVPNACGPYRLEPVCATRLPPCQTTTAGDVDGFSWSRTVAYCTRASLTTADPSALPSEAPADRVRRDESASLEIAGWTLAVSIGWPSNC